MILSDDPGHEDGQEGRSKRKQQTVGHVDAPLLSVKTLSLTLAIVLIGSISLIYLFYFLKSRPDISVFSLRKVPMYKKQGVNFASKRASRTSAENVGSNTNSDTISMNLTNDPVVDGSTLITDVKFEQLSGIIVEDLERENRLERQAKGIKTIEADNLYVELDENLNPNVNFSLPLREGFALTEFDREIFSLQLEHVVLHQTWKDTCVLETKKKYMKSWVQHEKSLKVVFWTDSLMESWVAVRFSGTYIYEAWLRIGASRDAHIKKADVFRALLIWYYGGVYADLDIKLKKSLKDFLKEKLTVIVWEPEESMLRWTEYEEGSPRKTLVLSGFLISGHRFSHFLGFYINWVAVNHLSGRSKWEDHVVDSTGPRVEAEAYYYYTGRIKHHDRFLHVQTYPQFLNYGEHFSATTWVPDAIRDISCVEINTVYSDQVLVMGKPS